MKAKKEQYKQTKNAAINGWKVNLSPPNEEIRQIMPQTLVLQQKEIAGYDCALTKGWHSRAFANHLTATCSLFDNNTNLFKRTSKLGLGMVI